jgi:hypothetical protein
MEYASKSLSENGPMAVPQPVAFVTKLIAKLI